MDECSEETHMCPENEVCVNKIGGYTCFCKLGQHRNKHGTCQPREGMELLLPVNEDQMIQAEIEEIEEAAEKCELMPSSIIMVFWRELQLCYRVFYIQIGCIISFASVPGVINIISAQYHIINLTRAAN